MTTVFTTVDQGGKVVATHRKIGLAVGAVLETFEEGTDITLRNESRDVTSISNGQTCYTITKTIIN